MATAASSLKNTPVQQYQNNKYNDVSALNEIPEQPTPGRKKVAAGWVLFGIGVITSGVTTIISMENSDEAPIIIGIGADVVAITGLLVAIAGHVQNSRARRRWQVEYSN